MSNQTDRTSLVPFYTFPETLTEQEEALKNNPLMNRMIESRQSYESDPHRPIYHYVNPEHTLNDPNGLCFIGEICLTQSTLTQRIAVFPVRHLWKMSA